MPQAPGRAGASASPRPLQAVRSRRPWSRRRPLRGLSPAAELRLALLQEGVHALDAVLRGHRELVEPALVVETGAERGLLGRQHRLLGEPRRQRRPLRDLLGQLQRCFPITRARRWVPPPPGMIPSRISGWPNWALSEATIMSQASASSQPPPRA